VWGGGWVGGGVGRWRGGEVERWGGGTGDAHVEQGSCAAGECLMMVARMHVRVGEHDGGKAGVDWRWCEGGTQRKIPGGMRQGRRCDRGRGGV
jgi:hypothetical protein